METSSVEAPRALTDALASVVDVELAEHPHTAAFTISRRAPRLVAMPATVAGLAGVVGAAARVGAKVVAWGAGTAVEQGCPPEGYDVAAVTRGLAGVYEHQPADLTVTCGAGTTLAEVAAALAPVGQLLPLDPPGGAGRTVGGVLATRASGPRRVARGHPRDLALGMQVVLADGQTVRTGGKVVKNVAGYDLTKLLIGSFGTLGLITEATFRVQPRPPREWTVVARLPDAEAALAAALEVRRRAVPLTALLVADAATAGRLGLAAADHLIVRLDGAATALERRREIVAAAAPGLETFSEAEAERLWAAVADFPLRRAGEAALVTRGATLPTHLAGLPAALRAAGERSGSVPAALYDAGTGVFHARWELPLVEGLVLVEAAAVPLAALRAALAPDGQAVVEAAPADLLPALDVWGPKGPDWAIMRRVKERLDPVGILAPGRMGGW
jgi:glycolate oxidase FAD binding subunit